MNRPVLCLALLAACLPSKDCQSVGWPAGTYGLYKTTSGCPGGNVNWSEGWRFHDSENNNNQNTFPDDFHLSGQFSQDIRTDFCIKENSTGTSQWPAGKYCILKYGNCPSGFSSSTVMWDDENTNNNNSYGGVMPSGLYRHYTYVYYCCRRDGQTSQNIILPTENPFILLAQVDECQNVAGMNHRQEVMFYHN